MAYGDVIAALLEQEQRRAVIRCVCSMQVSENYEHAKEGEAPPTM